MYAKLFTSLYQGTLRGRSHEILVFTNMLAHKDRAHFVDMHFRAIAEEVGLTEAEVRAACLKLEAADPESRSQDCNGARIERIDNHRDWGWRIVNGEKYQRIRDEQERAIQNAEAQRRFREKGRRNNSNQPSASVMIGNARKPASAHVEGEVDVDVDKKMAAKPPINDEDWLKTLESSPAYQGIDVKLECSKCEVWCLNNSVKFSRRRFVNWLNRCDRRILPSNTTPDYSKF